MQIEWNKVTWYSKLAAVVLGVLILILGFYLGMEYQKTKNNVSDSHDKDLQIQKLKEEKEILKNTIKDGAPRILVSNDEKYAVYIGGSGASGDTFFYPHGEDNAALVILRGITVLNLNTLEKKRIDVYEDIIPKESLEFMKDVPENVQFYTRIELKNIDPTSKIFRGEVSIITSADPPTTKNTAVFSIDLETMETRTHPKGHYINKKYGFEFDYPEEWETLENLFGGFNEFNITITPALKYHSQSIILQIMPEAKESRFDNLDTVVSDITIDGVKGKKYEYTFKSQRQTSIILPLKEKYISLGFEDKKYETEFYQIVNSLKFIE